MRGTGSRIMPITSDHFDRLANGIPGMGRDPASIKRRIEHMEHLLEGLVTIPGINRKIGLDVILDIIPVGGDAIAAAMGAWIVWEARNLGMSKWQLARMAGNVGFDFALGLIPIIGTVPDFFFRSNTMNLKMIKRHLDRHHPDLATVEGEIVRRAPAP
jgi:hypothetical protein